MAEVVISRFIDEVEEVDWASLEDAYGPATGTPELLRRLESGDENAEFDVCSFLWHQGTVYSATAPAVPFIVGLVEKGHANLLYILSLLADGHGYYLIHERNPLRRNTPQMQATLQREQGWVDAARQAVARGGDIYRPYLQAGNAKTRMNAAVLLARCAAQRPEILNWLAEALAQEKDAGVRASILATNFPGQLPESLHLTDEPTY